MALGRFGMEIFNTSVPGVVTDLMHFELIHSMRNLFLNFEDHEEYLTATGGSN